MDRADVVVKILLPVFKRAGDISLSYLMFLRAYALYHCYTASPGTAQFLAEEGLCLGEKSGIRLLDNMFLAVGLYGSYLSGNKDSGEKYFNELTLDAGTPQSFAQILHHLLASIKILHFNDSSSPVAIEHARQCLQITEVLGSPHLVNLHRFVLANTLIEAEKYDAARVKINKILDLNEAIQSSFHEYNCLLGESFILLRKGDYDHFAEKFKMAMVLSRSYRIPFFGYLHLSAASLLCAKALEAGVEVEHVRELIKRNNLSLIYTPAHGIEEWPYPVKFYTLGRFEIWREDMRVEFPRKVQKKTLSLLKLLISTEGKEIPEEGIIDVLWPDADGDQASHSFATALWRLRKLIGNDKAIIYRDGQLTLDRQQCWVDVWGFDHHLRQSEETAKGGKADRAISPLRKAIGMYRGHFLAGDGKEPWTLSQRERLRDRFIIAISRLGQHLEERGEIDEVISCYSRGIETDELAERLYQRLMLCHNRTGNRIEAIKTYKRLKTLLAIHLGIEPSRETEGIYQTILTG